MGAEKKKNKKTYDARETEASSRISFAHGSLSTTDALSVLVRGEACPRLACFWWHPLDAW